jgi:hypothetical protein
MVYATIGTHLRHVHTEKPVTRTLTLTLSLTHNDSYFYQPYFELLYILLLYYDVNVVAVFSPTKIRRVCGENRTPLSEDDVIGHV